MSTTQDREAQKAQFLRDYTKRYIHLIPEYLRENDSFLVFFALLCKEFNITLDNIRSFNDLVNPDKVPRKFLDSLGMYFNYHYQDRAPSDFNRELLMRNRKLFEDRGTEHSIIMAASHGDNEGYLGGEIFIPGYDISDELAELVVARDRIFIHSKSKLSSTSVYSDGDTYRPGVLIIYLSYLDPDIRNKLWEVIPAGIRLRYNLISDFRPNKQDPEDVYNFIPPTGAAKSKEKTLTWYPYFRVVPIPQHGDKNPEGLDYYDPYRNNYPIGLDYLIEMAINSGVMKDILIHSDKTINKNRLFDENGILVGDPNDVRLLHGRKLHSGTKLVDEYIHIDNSIGVSALPLSLVRKPFELSSIPQNAPYIEHDEVVIITPGHTETHVIQHITEERDSFKHSDILKDSKHSGESVFGGTYEEIEEEYEQEYIEPEEQVIPKKDYKYYRITPTGEYEDRIDKLTTDSVMRGFRTTLNLQYGYQKYHNMRRRSHHSGRHSGTVYNDQLNNILREVFLKGVRKGVINRKSYVDSFEQEYYARQKITENINKILDMICPDEDSELSSQDSVFYYLNMMEICEQNIQVLTESYENAKPHSAEKQMAYEQLENEKKRLYGFAKQFNVLKEEIEVLRKEIEDIYDATEIKPEDPEENRRLLELNKILKEEFESLYKWYTPSENPLFSGIYIPGDVNEYIPIMTMQPSDILYPISEVLDVKADYNRPWDKERWDGSWETESEFGLNQYGENRDPFFHYPIDMDHDYTPNTEGSDYIDFNKGTVLGFDVHHIEDTNIVKDANKTLIHSASGDVLSGKYILEIIRDREDGRGTIHVDKDSFIHNVSKFSGDAVFGGLSKEVLDRQYITEMYSENEPTSEVYIIKEYVLEDMSDVSIDIECEPYSGQGSIFSIIHSSLRGQFSGVSIYSGKQGQSKRLSPEGSFTHSAHPDGKHSNNGVFSGKSNWMNEPIIDATYSNIDSDIEIEFNEFGEYEFSADIEVIDTKIAPHALIFSSKNYIGKFKSSYHSGMLTDPYAYKEPTPDSMIHSGNSVFSGHFSYGGSEIYPGEPIVSSDTKEPEFDMTLTEESSVVYQEGQIDIDIEEFVVPYESLILSSPEHTHSSYRMFSGEWIYKSEPSVDMRPAEEPKVIQDLSLSTEIESYDVIIRSEVIESDYNKKAINLSYRDSKFSTLDALHSGDVEKPSKDSITYGKEGTMSGKLLHDGKLLTV